MVLSRIYGVSTIGHVQDTRLGNRVGDGGFKFLGHVWIGIWPRELYEIELFLQRHQFESPIPRRVRIQIFEKGVP